METADEYRLEFSDNVQKARGQTRWLAIAVVVYLLFLALGGVWVLWEGEWEQLLMLLLYALILTPSLYIAWRRHQVPTTVPAVRLDESGVEIWGATAEHLVLPWSVIESVRAGTLSIGLTLVPGMDHAAHGAQGLETMAGRSMVKALASPSGSPLYVEWISGYDKRAFTRAVERLSGGVPVVTA